MIEVEKEVNLFLKLEFIFIEKFVMEIFKLVEVFVFEDSFFLLEIIII